MLCFLNSLRHIVKTKVSFNAYLNEDSFKQANRPRAFVPTKILSKQNNVALELWLSIYNVRHVNVNSLRMQALKALVN